MRIQRLVRALLSSLSQGIRVYRLLASRKGRVNDRSYNCVRNGNCIEDVVMVVYNRKSHSQEPILLLVLDIMRNARGLCRNSHLERQPVKTMNNVIIFILLIPGSAGASAGAIYFETNNLNQYLCTSPHLSYFCLLDRGLDSSVGFHLIWAGFCSLLNIIQTKTMSQSSPAQ
ncbi:hypothetical protein F4801DRAFT_42092 [Xylaria longipes]|nr:hypothetical protein F4801DRAFT_42092 [Xylaria longipes]